MKLTKDKRMRLRSSVGKRTSLRLKQNANFKKTMSKKALQSSLFIDTKVAEADGKVTSSPSVRTIQDYYQDTPSAGLFVKSAFFPEKPSSSKVEVINGPRRHSVMLPETLKTDSWQVSSTPSAPPKALSFDSNLKIVRTAPDGVIVRVNNQPQVGSPIQNPLSPLLLGRLPYGYAHERLKRWGKTYFGNSSTADVLVQAVPLTLDVRGTGKSGSIRRICVRITPGGGNRKSFVLHKDFNLSKLSPKTAKSHSIPNTMTPRPSRSPSPIEEKQISAEKFGIHIEYALHRLPILAAILLSGHVLRGDNIELPLPRPEAWADTVKWMYIFDTPLTEAMRENINYLAGSIESNP